MHVPFVDLHHQYTELKSETDAAMARVIEQGAFIQGEPVARFEHALAASIGTTHACGLANGTAALWLAMKALGVGPGDEVITTPLTAICTSEAIVLNGAKPVFVDIDPATFQLDPDRVAAAVTPRTKGILPVHLYGIPADLHRLLPLAQAHGLWLLEDCAQAQGAEVGGRRVGSLGAGGCYSFFPSKNLGGMGDGGAFATSHPKLDTFVRMFSNHGRQDKYSHEISGTNERLDGLQAAILHVRLARLNAWNEHRRRAADLYAELLAEVEEVRLPQYYPGTAPVWHLYVIRAQARDKLAAALKAAHIGTGLHYPLPLHRQPAMAAGHSAGDFPEAERACGEILSLPMYSHVPLAHIEHVAASIKKAYAGQRSVVFA